MADLTRDLYIPLIDSTFGAEEGTYTWVRIDKSTIFELSFTPTEETVGYIDSANDSTYIKSYAPELPQEITLDNDNPLYKAMFEFCMRMPTGSDAEVPIMLVYPNLETGKATDAKVWPKATISPQTLNTIDKKLTFTLKLNGTPIDGTVSNSAGTWTFSPAV